MTHFPECPKYNADPYVFYCCGNCNPDQIAPWLQECMCDMLSACEERVRKDMELQIDISFQKGYNQATIDFRREYERS